MSSAKQITMAGIEHKAADKGKCCRWCKHYGLGQVRLGSAEQKPCCLASPKRICSYWSLDTGPKVYIMAGDGRVKIYSYYDRKTGKWLHGDWYDYWHDDF